MRDPTSFDVLDELREGLLIRYERRRDESFVLVATLVAKSPGSDREFARLLFTGVADWERERGERVALQHFEDRYWTKLAPSPTVIEAIVTRQAGSGTRIEFWFGPAFGGISFSFAGFSVQARASLAEQSGGSFVYRDAQSGVQMDFYDPFEEGPIDPGPGD